MAEEKINASNWVAGEDLKELAKNTAYAYGSVFMAGLAFGAITGLTFRAVKALVGNSG